MNKENHVYAPAYKQEDMDELVKICDHIIFNSVSQLVKYKDKCIDAGVSIGIRINPEVSTQKEHAIYDPCAAGSRLGVTLAALERGLWKMNICLTVLTDYIFIHFVNRIPMTLR